MYYFLVKKIFFCDSFLSSTLSTFLSGIKTCSASQFVYLRLCLFFNNGLFSSKFNEESENHKASVWDMTLFMMKSFSQLCVQVRVWKIKFWFIFAHFHVPLLILNTIFRIHQLHWMQKFCNIHQKVIYDFILAK